jgi:quercetin dioxygenase-like cupin family protein
MQTLLKAVPVAALITWSLIASAVAGEAKRTELKRTDLSGTAMEMVVSTITAAPGDTIARHSHHGEEAAYVLEGAMVEFPDGRQVMLETGRATINLRDVAHGGFKVIGDRALTLYTVHVVDKDKPLYEPVK